MDIKILYTLVAIAEHGSFLAASRTLGLSPAAVSLHIKIMEDELGFTLFDRSVRPPALTEPGRRTLARARRVIDAWERLGDSGPADVAGVLSIGAVPTAVGTLLAPALARLRERRPNLRVTLTTAYSEELVERVSRGNVDAALTMEPSSSPLDARFDPIMVEPFRVVVAQSVPGGSDEELLRTMPYIRFRRHAWITQLIESELGRRRLRLDAAMEIDTLSGVLALVDAGLGVSIVPARQLASFRTTTVRSVPFGKPPVSRTLGLLRRPDHPKMPQLDELMAALRDVEASPLSDEKQPEALAGSEQ
jgi:DNA-binding transcriptional LysR family regulator